MTSTPTTLALRTRQRSGKTSELKEVSTKDKGHSKPGRLTLLDLPTEVIFIVFDQLEGGSAPASVILGLSCKRLYDIHWDRHGPVNLLMRPAGFMPARWASQIKRLAYPRYPYAFETWGNWGNGLPSVRFYSQETIANRGWLDGCLAATVTPVDETTKFLSA